MRLQLTAHAAARLAERGIELHWVQAVVATPDRREPDPMDPSLTRSFGAVPAADGRVLRVVHRQVCDDILVVTAYFDRGART